MAERKTPRVPLAAVVVGGLVVGAVLFGAFRGMSAQPLPPVAADSADPFGTLPPLVIPPAAPSPLPAAPVQQVGGVLPSVTPPPISLPPLPKLDAKPELPVPVVPADPLPALPPAPKPAALPAPTFTSEPLPPPVALPPARIDPIPETKPEPVPPKPLEVAPVVPKLEPITPVLPKPVDITPVLPKLQPVVPPPADTLPKPVEMPQPVKPIDPPAVLSPVKPENGLRPELPPLTVNPGPLPLVGKETLPPPRKVGDETLPKPRPVVEESVTPMPKPEAVVPITTPVTPGMTPMPLSRHAILSTVMGAALAAAPAYAQEPKPAADAEAVKKLQTQIDDMKKDITYLKEQRNDLHKQLNGLPESERKTLADKGALLRLQEAEANAEKMAKQVKELEAQLAQKSVSEKTPVGGTGAGPAISSGRGLVKIVNEYNVKCAMMVNGISYPLGVNETKSVEVPEGKLRYELVEFPNASAKETTIKEGETVTLRIK